MEQFITNTKNFLIKLITFVSKHLLAIGLILASIILVYLLVKYESKPIKNILTTDYTKSDSEILLFKDSLIREYTKIDSRKDSLQNVINNLLKENKTLSLQTDLLKFKQNKIKVNEKNIQYISGKNTTIDSALTIINRVVTKYPIEIYNK